MARSEEFLQGMAVVSGSKDGITLNPSDFPPLSSKSPSMAGPLSKPATSSPQASIGKDGGMHATVSFVPPSDSTPSIGAPCSTLEKVRSYIFINLDWLMVKTRPSSLNLFTVRVLQFGRNILGVNLGFSYISCSNSGCCPTTLGTNK